MTRHGCRAAALWRSEIEVAGGGWAFAPPARAQGYHDDRHLGPVAADVALLP